MPVVKTASSSLRRECSPQRQAASPRCRVWDPTQQLRLAKPGPFSCPLIHCNHHTAGLKHVELSCQDHAMPLVIIFLQASKRFKSPT